MKKSKSTQKSIKKEVLPTVLSQNIDRLMYEKRISVADIMTELGVSKQIVYDYRKGKSVPGKDKLEKLASMLGVTVASLYTKRDELQEIKKEVKEVLEVDNKYIKSLEDQIQLLKELLSACRDQKK